MSKYDIFWSLVALAILWGLVEAFGFWPVFATYATFWGLWLLWMIAVK